MKLFSIVLYSSLVLLAKSASVRASVRDVLRKVTGRNASPAFDANPATSIDTVNGEGRDLQSGQRNCWGARDPDPAWHPVYSAGWTNGYCRFTIDCDSPGYSSELACCKVAYSGQVSGHCLIQLPSPPTTSPTDNSGLDIFYPDYDTAWTDAGCINKAPMPSGRPMYTTMLACCKGAYAGQVSGKCLSMLPSPPTTSPTNSDFDADFWYPIYELAWSESGCSNKLPLPFKNKNDRPNYSSQLACCKGAYGGQVSGACLSMLPNPPTSSPTGSGGANFWYRDYSVAWDVGTCINALPLPIQVTEWNTHPTKEQCCSSAFGGQASNACVCSLDDKPKVCYEVKTTEITSTVDPSTLGVTVTLPLPTGSALTTLVNNLKQKIEAKINALRPAGQKVVEIIILSIAGQSMPRRRLGEVLAPGRLLQTSTDIKYKAKVEFTCLPNECAAVGTTLAEEVVNGICPVDNSCTGTDACTSKTGDTGCNSCQGEQACPVNQANIGYESCHGFAACVGLVGHPGFGAVVRTFGNKSCRSTSTNDGACRHFYGANIGSESCNGEHVCKEGNGNIGNNSCNGEYACTWINGSFNNMAVSTNTVGDNSCNAKLACYGANRDIAPNSCNQPCECCVDFPGENICSTC